MRALSSLSILATGLRLTPTAGASVNGTIPNTSIGTRPRRVRVASTAAAAIRLGLSAPTAVNTDALVQPGDALLLEVGSNTHIAAIDLGGSPVVIVTPTEDS